MSRVFIVGGQVAPHDEDVYFVSAPIAGAEYVYVVDNEFAEHDKKVCVVSSAWPGAKPVYRVTNPFGPPGGYAGGASSSGGSALAFFVRLTLYALWVVGVPFYLIKFHVFHEKDVIPVILGWFVGGIVLHAIIGDL